MEKFLRAIYFANDKHNGQLRKDGKTPVVTHLLTVGLLLSGVTNKKDTIVAGILHDTLEDTKTTPKELEKLFGKRVRKIVEEVSEKDRKKNWEKRWHERKKKTLEKIKKMSKDAALVLSADTTSNQYELLKNLKISGLKFAKYFHSSIDDKLEYDFRKLNEIKKYHSNPMLKLIRKNIIESEKIVKSLRSK